MLETELDYVVKNFPANGDKSLEDMRQAALKELSELRACVVGRLYRGVFIYTLPGGNVFVLGDGDKKYDCLNVSEARALIDAALSMHQVELWVPV